MYVIRTHFLFNLTPWQTLSLLSVQRVRCKHPRRSGCGLMCRFEWCEWQRLPINGNNVESSEAGRPQWLSLPQKIERINISWIYELVSQHQTPSPDPCRMLAARLSCSHDRSDRWWWMSCCFWDELYVGTSHGSSLEFSQRSYNGGSFDINIDGPTDGANNVCMLAAFGNGGVVPTNCVPVTGTQARFIELLLFTVSFSFIFQNMVEH